jgi:guanylate kinase
MVVSLQNKQAFIDVLSHYEPASKVIDIFCNTPLVLLVGPTAAGRNTLIKLLEETGKFHMIVSDTTRPPRLEHGELEKDGVVYWFKPEEEVLAGLHRGEYIEANIIHQQQVSGANYKEFEKATNEHKIAIKEIEIGGAATYLQINPTAHALFVLPPSFDEWMHRLHSRSSMSSIELRNRLISAEQEITQALHDKRYVFVVNNDVRESAREIDSWMHDGHMPDQKTAHAIAQELLVGIEAKIETLSSTLE